MIWWAAIWGSVAGAATIEVGATGDLQQAIEDAGFDDVIVVAEGVYVGPFVVAGKTIEIVGAGADLTTLEGTLGGPAISVSGAASLTVRAATLSGIGVTRGLHVEESEVTLDGITFVGGAGDGPSEKDGGDGGDLFADSADVTITDCRFVANTRASYGGHIAMTDSTAAFASTTIRNGTASDLGGGVYLNRTTATFTDCTIADNVADRGGGAFLRGSPAAFEGGLVEGNQAEYAAGGIAAEEDLTLQGTTLRGNTNAYGAGALDVYSADTVAIVDGTFEGNQGRYGGAVSIGDVSDLTIWRSTFAENAATIGGGAIYLSGGSQSAEIAGNRFCGDRSFDYSAAIDVSYTTLNDVSVHHNTFIGESALGSGIVTTEYAPLIFTQNTIAGATETDGLVFLEFGVPLLVTATAINNAFVGSPDAAAFLHGFSVPGDALTESYNLFWEVDPFSRNLSPTDSITADPLFVSYEADDCASDLRPAAGSPLVDAGHPSAADDDGSPSDIGAFGGEGATRWVDVDGDGQIEDDCAPFDPAVSDCGDGEVPTTQTSTPEEGVGGDGARRDGPGGAGVPSTWFCASGGSAAGGWGLSGVGGWLVVWRRRGGGSQRSTERGPA